jgi:hypothetical protein
LFIEDLIHEGRFDPTLAILDSRAYSWGLQLNAGAATAGIFVLFNSGSGNRTFYVYEWEVAGSAQAFVTLGYLKADPGLAASTKPINLRTGDTDSTAITEGVVAAQQTITNPMMITNVFTPPPTHWRRSFVRLPVKSGLIIQSGLGVVNYSASLRWLELDR